MNKKLMIIGVVLLILFSIGMYINPVVGQENTEFVDLNIDSELVFVNNDDDDGNGTPDMYQNGSTSNENDLELMTLEIGLTRVRSAEPLPVPMTVNYSLNYHPNIRLWDHPQRGDFAEDEILNNTLYPHMILILGDMNLDGFFNGFDTDVFYDALGDPEQYKSQYGVDPIINGDINGDGSFNGGDIDPYTDYLEGTDLWYAPARLWIEGLISSLGEIVISAQVDFEYQVMNDSDIVSIIIPQLVISALSFVIEGETFEVSVTANDNPIDAEITFDGNIYTMGTDGNVTLTAPQVEEDTDYDITSRKEGYTSVTESIIVKDKVLVVDAPFSVFEGEIFEVSVKEKVTGQAVEGANVTFNGEVNQSDTNGEVNFLAPPVDATTEYTITASLSGYKPGMESIIVLNPEDQEIIEGWIFGIVTSGSATPLENVQICVIFENSTTTRCVTTDNQGTYHVQVPRGTHSIMASKTGYQSVEYTKTIEASSALEQNFILREEIQEPESPSSFQEEVITYALQTGKVGTEINIDEQENQQITLYTEINVDIEPRPSEQIFSFVISAEDETPGTVFILKIENIDEFFHTDTIDITNVRFKFDGESVEKTDFSQVIDADEESPTWTGFIIDDTLYILGWIPHFSEHTITISSVVEAVGGIVAVVFYIAVFVVLAIITGIPMIRLWKKIE